MTGSLWKHSGFNALCLASASFGFVIGFACFAGRSLPLEAYGKFWFFAAGTITALFVSGLIINDLMRRMSDSKPLLSLGNTVANAVSGLSLSVERRFRGDRTDEEYDRAAVGVLIVVALLIMIAMLFLLGTWLFVPFALYLYFSIARNVFVAITESRKYGYRSPLGFLTFGFFLALLFGLFHGF